MAWVIWTLATIFTTFQFSLQTITNLMVSGMQSNFHLSAAGVGALASSIYLTFLPLQVPVGMLYDNFNTRTILTIGASLCGLGCFIFASTDNLAVAYAGRMIMGLGCGTGYVGMLHIINIYFDARMFVFLVGLAESISMIITALIERMGAYIIENHSWQNLFHGFGVVSLILSFLIFITIEKNKNADEHPTNDILLKNFSNSLKTVASSQRAWIAGFFGCSMYCIISVFTALWGTKFLIDVYHMSRGGSAFAIEFIFYGIAVGSPIVTLYQSRYGNTRNTMIVTASLTILSILILLFVYPLNNFSIYMLLAMMGAASSGYLISYDILKQLFPANVRGTAAGFGNMLVCLGGLAFQPLVGLILDASHGTHSSGISHYSLHDYRVGLSVIIGFIFLATLAAVKIGSEQSIIQEQDALTE